MYNLKKKHILIPLLVGVFTPSLLIFIFDVFASHISPISSLLKVLSQQFGGDKLFLIMLFGLIPFVLLIRITALVSRKLKGKRLDCIFWGGLIGILALMLYAHIWIMYPNYGDGHNLSTSSVGFIFIPFLCSLTMGIGLLIGFLISRIPFFKNQNKEKPLNY